MRKLLEKGQGYELYLDPELPALINIYTGEFQSSAESRSHIMRILEAYKEHKPQFEQLAYVSDTLKMGAMSPEDSEWGFNYFTPAAVEAGMRLMALVVPENVFTSLAFEEYNAMMYSNFGLTSQVFPNIEEAINFVRNRLQQ